MTAHMWGKIFIPELDLKSFLMHLIIVLIEDRICFPLN